jgi:peptide chain release factor 2
LPTSPAGWAITGGFFDVEAKQSLVSRLEEAAQQPDYWNDNRKAQSEQAALHEAQNDIQLYKDLEGRRQDIEASVELLEGAEDEGLSRELASHLQELSRQLDRLDFTRMLSGPYDRKNALLTIRPGAGGTESQDWAQMLLRMYTRWAEAKKFKVSLLELQPGEEAGIKVATLQVEGDWAYGFLRAEKGVHRLVRISPFDSNARRHTSFASVEPFPEIDDTIEVVIEDKDLRIDTYRSSGAGGQHVNRTDSAVRITHLPTGIVVACQNERSQIKNRAQAMKVLRARLFTRAEEEQKEKMAGIAGEKKNIQFGSQIRSYVLHPYQQVKDHRTDFETSRTDEVLDGDLDELIEVYLKQQSVDQVRSEA